MNNGSVSMFQVGMIFMLSTGLMNHVIIIPLVMDTAKRDGWISVLVAGGLSLVWVALLALLISGTGRGHFFAWLGKAYSPIIGRALATVSCVYLLCLCGITMRDTVTWIKLSFSPSLPTLVPAVLLVAVCAANAYMGLRSLAYTAGILLPVVILLGLFVMLANVPHKHYFLLKPFLEYGMKPVWHGALYVSAGLLEVIMILFMKHRIRSNVSFVSLGLLIVLLAGLTVGPIMGAIIEFGPDQAGKLRYPAYEEWRLVTIGRYIEHLDFLSIYQWFSGAFLRVSLTMYLIPEVLNMTSKRGKGWMLGAVSAVMVGIAVLPFSDPFFLSLLSRYAFPWIVWGVFGFSVVSAILVYGSKLRRRVRA